MESNAINQIINQCSDTGNISDGYHTFDELYAHRISLFIALCKEMERVSQPLIEDKEVWKSRTQSDGVVLKDWFIMGIGKRDGTQISYHLPISEWENCYFAINYPIAPEWDGHTSGDVVKRLKKL